MGVYIKGMEMPKRGMVINIYANGRVTNHFDEFGEQIGTAVPVPPHGRLIDADALEDYVIALKRDAIHAYEWTGKSGEWNTRITEREIFAATIEDYPTIIEAEEGE